MSHRLTRRIVWLFPVLALLVTATRLAGQDDTAPAPAPAAESEATEPADDEAGHEAGQAEHEAGQEAKAEGKATEPHDTHGDDTAGHEGPAAGGGHGGDDHHDPFDLSATNATESQDKPQELRTDLAIWTLVVFLLLLAVLTRFAWRPLMNGLERREQHIAEMIEDARRSSEKAAAFLKQYEAKMAATSDEIRDMMAQARKDAEQAKERILGEASVAAQRERERAVADINVAKNAALQEMTEKSVDLAVTVAGRLIHRQLTVDDRANLVREALGQLPSQN